MAKKRKPSGFRAFVRKQRTPLIIIAFILFISIGLAVLILNIAVQTGEADSVELTIIDFATGEDVSADVDIAIYLIKQSVWDAGVEDAEIYDLSNFDLLITTKANNVTNSLIFGELATQTNNRSIAWLKITGATYVNDYSLVGANGQYTIYAYPLSTNVNFQMLNSSFDPFITESWRNDFLTSQSVKCFIGIPASESATKCQGSIYDIAVDTHQASTGNLLSRVTQAFAIEIDLNDTIVAGVTDMDIEVSALGSDLFNIEILKGTEDIFIVILDAFNGTSIDAFDITITTDNDGVGGDADIGIDEISAIRLNIPADDNVGIAVATTYSTKQGYAY